MSRVIMTTRGTQITPIDNELKDYLTYIYGICKCIFKAKSSYVGGPVHNYEQLHIQNNEFENGNQYAPVLVSKSFDSIYTNTGIIKKETDKSDAEKDLDNEIKGERKKDIIESLNLKVYNNKYYYVDKKESSNYLTKYYKLEEIKKNWKILID